MHDLRMRFGAIFALALLPLLVFAVIQSVFEFQKDRKDRNAVMRATTIQAAAEITDTFSNAKAILAVTGNLVESSENCGHQLDEVIRAIPQLDYLGITDVSLERVILAGFKLRELRALTDRSLLDEDTNIAIINHRGEALLGGETQSTATRLSWIEKVDAEGQFEGKVNDVDGSLRDIFVVRSGSDNLYVAMSVPESDIVSWSQLNPFSSIIMPLFAWLFGFVAIWLATDKLVLIHLRKMQHATKLFAKGDFEARVGTLNDPPMSIKTLGYSFDSLADSLAKLVHRGLYESNNLRYVNMDVFLNRLIDELSLALGMREKNIKLGVSVNCKPMEAETATPVALFIVEALTNAVKHGVHQGGEIAITLIQQKDDVTVSIKDDGVGFDEAKQSLVGTGTKLIKGFARQLGGRIDVKNDTDGYKVSFGRGSERRISPRSKKLK